MREGNGHVQGGEFAPLDLPPTRGPMIRIWRARVGRPVRGLILQEMVYVGTHHYGGRTHAHTAPVEVCEGCKQGAKLEGKGYFLVLDVPTTTLRLAELSDYAIRHCPILYQRETPKVGRQLEVFRLGKADNSPLGCKIGQHVTSLPPGLRPVDVAAQLTRIWSAPDRSKDEPGPDASASPDPETEGL